MASLKKKYECLFNAAELVAYKLKHSVPLFLSVNFIRSLHKEIYAYYRSAAGNFRTPVYGIKISSKTLVPVPPNEIRTRLLDLCDLINRHTIKAAVYKKYFTSNIEGYNKMPRKYKKYWYAIFSASYIHHQITYIHPFTGGNGRLARLLMSMELANHNMYEATYPPLLNQAIKMNREKYLKALGKADKGNYMHYCIFLSDMLEFSLRNEKNIARKIKKIAGKMKR